MRICGIDFETEGLDPKEHGIIEIGAVIYDVETETPLQVMSELVDQGRPVPEEITALTGITTEAIQEFGVTEDVAIGRLAYMLDLSDYGMAHNAARFDKLFFDAACAKHDLPPRSKLWIDTLTDVKFAPEIKTRNLNYLAAEFSFVNPFKHRALFDVMTMLKITSRFDINEIIARAKEPTLYVQAFVSFNDKDKAKELGFRWYAPSKIWWKDMKASDYEAMKDACEFNTGLLAGPLE